MTRNNRARPLSSDGATARRQILSSAQRVMLRYGLAKTTMDDVAVEAGVSRPTVYRYFGDRDTLFSEVIKWRARGTLRRGRALLDDCPTFADKIVTGLPAIVFDGINDPIVRILVSPEHVGGSSWMDTVPLAEGLTAELWAPVFDDAKAEGIVRADIDTDEACAWLTLVQLMLVPRLDGSTADDAHARRILEFFILPSFLDVGMTNHAKSVRSH